MKRALLLTAFAAAAVVALSGCAGQFGQLVAKDIQSCDRHYTGSLQGAPMAGLTGGVNLDWTCRHTVPWADQPPASSGPPAPAA